MKKPLNRLTPDPISNQNFEELSTFAQAIINGKLLDNVLIEDVVVGTSNTNIAHKLGRKPIGWIVIKKNANANVWEPVESPSPSSLLTLIGSTQVTVSLLVF